MLNAGDQVPTIPFVEVVRSGLAAPAQIGAMAAKVGIVAGFTVTVIVVVEAHCPVFGVKV